ncbi:MAG: AAA family ATPase, partial [Saccharothrix sp.]|nr:AAA family ATPase [Saccharothrix sp.]
MERIDDYLDAQEVRLGGLLNDLRQAHRSSSEQPTTTGPVEPPLFPSRHGGAKRPPRSGWRKTLLSWSGGLVNLGEGPADVRRRKLINLIDRPLHACYKIAVLSLKGGVGKTTTTVNLGSTFASLRGDRVIAVDADPDRGTLALKVPRETTATVRHLLRDAAKI